MELDGKFQFHCHPGVACFNACCKGIDIALTPYDILRLKNRLGISSTEFLVRHTTRFDMDARGPLMRQLLDNGVTLMKFGFRILKQVLFGEATIPLKPDALEKRIAAHHRAAQRGAIAEQPIS